MQIKQNYETCEKVLLVCATLIILPVFSLLKLSVVDISVEESKIDESDC